MIHLTTKQIVAFSAAFFLLTGPCVGQDDCKVLLDALAGQYEGDCRKGLAEGEGTAKGKDTYVGEFRKGLPHGTGKYTSANGDIYEGEFKKGRKEGKGKLSSLQPDGKFLVKTGYWGDDKYIGENATPYKTHYTSTGVLSARISEIENTDASETALLIEFLHKGKPVPNPDFVLTEISGSYISKFPAGMGTRVIVTGFPFRFTIGYLGESVDIEIYKPTSWRIRIDYNK